MTKRKLERGTPLTQATGVLAEAITKGSLEYVVNKIGDAFREQFPMVMPANGEYPRRPYIVETFADYVIVKDDECASEEYYRVPFTLDGDKYVFTPREQWELVELAYKPATPEPPAASESPAGDSALGERSKPTNKRKRIIERRVGDGMVALEEADENGLRVLRVDRAMTANSVNGNRRRYPASVLAAAVQELKTHLHESAGQARLQVLGEAEHPSDKGNRNSQLLETIVKWNDVSFNGEHVSLRGHILNTSNGRDMIAVIEGGVAPGTSMRGYGDFKIVTDAERGKPIHEVTELHITGFDLVSEPSFSDSQAMLESRQPTNPTQEVEMTLEQLKKLITDNPDLFKGLFEGKVEELSADALKRVEETVRGKLGIGADADLGKALTEAANAVKQLEEQKRVQTVEAAIAEATKGLPYGDKINKTFVEAVRNSKPADAEAVKQIVEAKRKEYDAFAANAKLAAMGFNGVRVVGPVIENELGIPEFARASHQFTEAMAVRGSIKAIDLKKPANRNELFTQLILKRFDETYARIYDPKLQRFVGLMEEAKLLAEAEIVSDLSLPYSASRAIIQAATAQLVASSVFDFGVIDTTPTRVYYEQYSQDTTVTKTVAMGEVVVLGAAALATWVAAANKRLIPGTLTVKNEAEAVTYVEGTDYVCDYGNGALMAILGGALAAGATVHVGYQYLAIRKGEMGVIERGQGTLGYVLLDCQADRLAGLISSEAILFSRSQLGWDAVARTMAMIVEQVRRKIDGDSFRLALGSALSVASNIAGTWTSANDPLSDFVAYLGTAKVKVENRYYTAESAILSKTRSNDLSNWDGFTRNGFVDATIKNNGYVATLKGLNFYETSEFSDSFALVTNREQVMHRVYQPMIIKGPHEARDTSTGQLIAAEEYYCEEYNGEVSPVAGKASVVKIA